MRALRRSTTASIVLAALAFGSVAQTLAESDTHRAIASYLLRWQADSGAPGVSAAIAVNGRIEFSGGVGLADLDSGSRQDARSVHNIGSVSKVQAVVAVMQLVEQGKVDLDAEIQTYAAWFPKQAHPITVRQLLTHTSGIRHYQPGEFGTDNVLMFRHYATFEESTRFWRDAPLAFRPGTHWMYSSFAINLIQAIVETASGDSFEKYLARHVWQPAGMIDTSFDVPARIVSRRGKGYVRAQRGTQLQNAPAEDVSYKYAGGGVLSTDEDLCRFGIALNSGRLLRPASIAEMYRLQLAADISYNDADGTAHAGKHRPSAGLRQGLVFGLYTDVEGRRYAAHTGSVKGAESQFTNYFQNGVVVALHFNLEGVNDTIGLRTLTEALAQLYLPALVKENAKRDNVLH